MVLLMYPIAIMSDLSKSEVHFPVLVTFPSVFNGCNAESRFLEKNLLVFEEMKKMFFSYWSISM